MAYLIINADDFGYSRVYNEVIIDLSRKGYITSTSLMIQRVGDQKDQIDELSKIAKDMQFSIGLHVELSDGDFNQQIKSQFALFHQVFGFGPMYIDLHKGTYLEKGYPLIMKFCIEKNLPCKNYQITDLKPIMTKEPTFDATARDFLEIETWLKSLKDEAYLIQMHPGRYDPLCKSTLNEERETDAANILKMHDVMHRYGITPIPFHFLPKYL